MSNTRKYKTTTSLFAILILLFSCFSIYSQTASSNRFKRIDYEYDLVSGKVNKVSYQKDSADQFIHQYSYDSDNRITKVETSSDNVVWDVDAKYFYYAHGPLARTEIGNDKVQGIDYAYTLQGWIKGVNSNTLDKKRDMGQDGKDTSIYDPNNPQLHANFAQDAFGYSLNYFKGDYKAISQVRWNNATNRFEAVTTGSDLMASRHYLHNGNISSMVTTIVKPTITPGDTMQFVPLPQGTAYKYDQLNRLVEMKAWQNLNSTNNTWGTGLTYNGMYNNKFSYDANGNILTQLRKDASGTAINDLSYNRYNLAGKTMQNRLYMVDDAIGNTAFTDDIDDQGTFDNSTYNNVTTNNNYGYDEIGNMNRNNQKEIAQIKYTVYGKVKEVIRTSGSSKKNLKFDYDPSGNRIAKHVYNSSNVWEKTEYYVLDAQGNTISVYKHEATGGTPPISFAQIERNIYGSSRIGSDKTHKELIGAFANTNLTHVIGNKQYDGVNHLGNVLVSFTDKRLPVDADNNSVIDGYWPEVVSANDYYPFGVKMKERSFASSNNRYQFNNKQYDDETETSDFGARILDADLGVWNALDQLFAKYPYSSPYHYGGNCPILFIDPNGKEIVLHFKDKDGQPQIVKYTANMSANTGNSFVDEAITTLNTLHNGSKAAATYIDQAIVTEHKLDISYGNKDGAAYDSQGNDKSGNATGTFEWNPFIGDKMPNADPTSGETTQSSGITLIHEMKHFIDHSQLLDNVKNGVAGAAEELEFFLTNGGAEEEKYYEKYENNSAVKAETEVAKDFKMGTRDNYDVIPKKVNTDGGMSTQPTKDKTKKQVFNSENKSGAGSVPQQK